MIKAENSGMTGGLKLHCIKITTFSSYLITLDGNAMIKQTANCVYLCVQSQCTGKNWHKIRQQTCSHGNSNSGSEGTG